MNFVKLNQKMHHFDISGVFFLTDTKSTHSYSYAHFFCILVWRYQVFNVIDYFGSFIKRIV